MRQRPLRRWAGAIPVSIFLVLCLIAEGLAVPGLPVVAPQSQWRPLEQWQDPELQALLNSSLKQRPLWNCLIAEHRMAVGLVDLSNPGAPRFAQVNGNAMLPAASIPKLAVLLAAFQGFEDRTLRQTPQVTLDLHDMIRESSNSATANLIARLGLRKIESLLLNPPYRFYNPEQGGGIWLGTTFAPYGERIGDPLKNLYLGATATQVCRFYYLLAYGKLINSKRSIQMMQFLSNPELHDKFVAVLERSMSTYRIFRKNGTYRTTHGDSVLVWGEGWRRYILVGLVDDSQGEQILRDLVPVAERVLRQSPARSR